MWHRPARAWPHAGRIIPPCNAVIGPTCPVMCRRCYFSRVAQIKIELCNDFASCNHARRAAAKSASRFAIDDEGESAGSSAEPPDSDSQNMASSDLARESSPPPFGGSPSDLAELDREFEALVGGTAAGEST